MKKTINIIAIIGCIIGVLVYWAVAYMGIVVLLLVLSWWSGSTIVIEANEIERLIKKPQGRRGHKRQ